MHISSALPLPPRPAGVLFTPRIGQRRDVALQARLTWLDQTGSQRYVSVVITDLSDADCFVECRGAASIPRYKLVHLQLEKQPVEMDALPAPLRQQRKALAIVFRVGDRRTATGTPSGYGLRLVVNPPATADFAEGARAN